LTAAFKIISSVTLNYSKRNLTKSNPNKKKCRKNCLSEKRKSKRKKRRKPRSKRKWMMEVVVMTRKTYKMNIRYLKTLKMKKIKIKKKKSRKNLRKK
jgi:hypothetical protein